MNRTAAIEYIENFVDNPENYDCEGIVEQLEDEYSTLDMSTLGYDEIREVVLMNSTKPYDVTV